MTLDDAHRILAEAMGDKDISRCEKPRYARCPKGKGCKQCEHYRTRPPDYRNPANFVRVLEWIHAGGGQFTCDEGFWLVWIGRAGCEKEGMAGVGHISDRGFLTAGVRALAEAVERSKG